MRYYKIPDETVRRLQMYLRGLLLFTEQGTEKVSSKKLAELLGVNSPQIRKDLSYFGDFGTPGVGYDTNKLLKQVKSILKLNIPHEAVLVGYGNLGAALLKYPGFDDYGLTISSIFENDNKKIGRKVHNIKIEDVSKLSVIKRRKTQLGIIAVPSMSAQEIADKLIAAGICGILNFAPCYLDVPKRVKVITIDIAMDLARLPYYLPASA